MGVYSGVQAKSPTSVRRLKKRVREDVEAPDGAQGGLEDEGFEPGPSARPMDTVRAHATSAPETWQCAAAGTGCCERFACFQEQLGSKVGQACSS